MSRSRRHSHMRVARRRALARPAVPQMVPCPHCREPMVPHRVCPSCGYYNGRPVVTRERTSR